MTHTAAKIVQTTFILVLVGLYAILYSVAHYLRRALGR